MKRSIDCCIYEVINRHLAGEWQSQAQLGDGWPLWREMTIAKASGLDAATLRQERKKMKPSNCKRMIK